MENNFEKMADLAQKMHKEAEDKMNIALTDLDNDKDTPDKRKEVINSLVNRVRQATKNEDKDALEQIQKEAYNLINSL